MLDCRDNKPVEKKLKFTITVAYETKSKYSKHHITAPNIRRNGASNPHYDMLMRNTNQRPELELQGCME